ncbi:MAG: FprA family A-type flavoprotein [Prevotellaceae bacterium]|jgi:flavorubredoxin|nr:FprA family A-type flavoprotein [Prevotellaceae bacterium]
MFKNYRITDDIFYVGVNDRQKVKFENLIPLTKGVSYNSYLIIDEKIALIDAVDISFADVYMDKINAQLNGRKPDYVIVNHTEPDHSGALRVLMAHFPDMCIVGNKKTLDILNGFYRIAYNTLEVADGDTLSLGNHELQFYLTPMVHWPETMMTFDKSAKILFSGDAFGSFGALNGALIDEDMNIDGYWDELILYYANIVGKYGSPVQKALEKVGGLPFEIICSTHGPVWKKYLKETVGLYDRLSRYEGEKGIVIVYGSMYGNTALMAETVAQGAGQAGVKNIIVHNASLTDSSVILRDIFKYKGLIIGSPTYSNELYPEIDAIVRKIAIRGIKNRVFGYFGSFTWAGASVKRLASFAETMKWEPVLTPVEEKQGLKEEKYNACLELGAKVAGLL